MPQPKRHVFPHVAVNDPNKPRYIVFPMRPERGCKRFKVVDVVRGCNLYRDLPLETAIWECRQLNEEDEREKAPCPSK